MRNLYQMRKKILIISFAVVLIALCITMCVLYLKTTNASQNNAGANTLVGEASLQSDIYHIEEGYISRILPETTLRDLKNNLDKEDITITKKDGNLLKETEFVGTGMTLKYGQKEYKLAVIDDLNGDGKAGITDLTQMKLISVGLRAKPVNEYAKAGDINNDGKVSITDLTKSNLASVNLIDIIAPARFTPEVVSTKDTITVEGETSDSNSGIKEYWFEINNNGWVQNTDKLNTKYTFEGLNMETKYTIRMKAVDKAGNVRVTKRIEIETLNEENANISIVASTEEWTNQNILVAINFNSNVAKEKKQISLDNGNTWVDYTAPITVEKNITIKARVVNTSGVVLEEQQKQITNIDKLAPKEFTMTVTSTTNSITVNALAEDADATEDNGKSGIKEYEYILINGIWSNSYKTTETTYTFSDLTPGIEYTIKVKAIDNAGNEKMAKNSNGNDENGEKITIGTIDDLIESLGGIRITATPSTENWINQNVRVTVTYPEIAGLTKEISTDDGQNWKTYTGSETIQGNTIIKARMKDSKNQTSTERILEITNIDKLAPKEFTMTVTSTTDSITVRASAEDAEAENGSAKSGIAGYKFKINEEEWTEIATSGTHTFSNLSSGTQYTIRVKAIDNAGNERMAKNSKGNEGEGEETITKTIDDLIEETGEEITITPSTTEWTNENITITVTYPEIAGLIKEISTDDGQNWKTYTGSETIQENTTVKARMKDSKNQTSTEKTLEITNMDKLAPKEFTMTVTSTTDSITVSVLAEDAEAENGSAKSGIAGYKFKINEEEWTEIATSGTHTFSNLSSGTQYTIRVKAIDNAGNERMAKNSKGNEGEGEETITKTIDDLIEETGEEITITPSTTEWTNENITITVTYPEIAGLTEEISIDNGYNWTTYTEPVEVEGNTTVKARMKDNKNQTSTEKALEITNIDKLAPKEFTMTVTSTTDSITVSALAEDADATEDNGKSGMAGYKFKINEEEWTEIATSGTHTFSNLTSGTQYTIKVKAIDNAGNERMAKNSKGNEGEGEETETKTIDDLIEETGEEITIEAFPSTENWTNQNVTVTITYPEIAGLTKEISIDNGYNWTTYTEPVEVEGNTTVKARMKDNKNQTSTEKTLLIDKIDKLPPVDFDVTIETTANTIKLTASTADAEAANGSAKSGIAGYKFKIDEEEWTEIVESGEYTFTELTEGQTYKIVVKAVDNAGNETIARNCKNGENEGLDITPTLVPEYYGKEVTNYESPVEGIKWRIYHKDDENIYLIADDYVAYNNLPTSTVGTALNRGNTVFEAKFVDMVNGNDYSGSEWILNNTNPKAQKWLNIYLTSYPDNTNHNMRAIAYMMDTTKWSEKFANSDMAEYAIGGPTIQLFCASYKATHPDKYIECDSINSIGYETKWNTDDKYTSSTGSVEEGEITGTNLNGLTKDDFNGIYIKSDKNKSPGMWVASPGGMISLDIYGLTWSGTVGKWSVLHNELGFRPIVCIKSGYDIVKNDKTSEEEEDTYRIVDVRPTYTVELNANGGIVVPAVIEGKGGETATLPTPTKEDHEFKGWYTDEELTTEVTLVDGKYIITESTTLYAKWQSLQVWAKLYADGTDKTLVFTNANKELSGYGTLEASYDNIHNYTFSENNSPWLEDRESITKVVIAEKIVPLKTDYLFYNMTNVTTMDLSNLDTSKVTGMFKMFNGCSNLTSLDVSNFDTSNVINMSCMFTECNRLTSLDLSNFDTSNVKSMWSMFSNCSALRLLDLSNFDTSKVDSMVNMFGGCSSLTSLDVSNFDTSNVTDMRSMFARCSNLISLDVSNFDTSKVTDMEQMFNACSGLTSLDVSNFDTSNVINMSWMFTECNRLTSLDLSNFNTTNVILMRFMFKGCTRLNTLNLSNFNTSNVTRMSEMFDGCSNLQSLDLSSFDTRQVTDINYMFRDCSSLTSLNVSSFNTSKVDYMSALFRNCSSLKTLNLSNFETSKVWCFGSMFEGCTNLETLDVSNFNTIGINNAGGGYGSGMDNMFKGCTKLTELDLTSFYYPEEGDGYFSCSEMFYDCTMLETVKVSSIWHNTDNTYLFNGSIATDVTRV